MQVCLAAETCGHVDFNIRGDVWYSSEPFHCGDVPPGHVTYWQIFCKVRSRKGRLDLAQSHTAAGPFRYSARAAMWKLQGLQQACPNQLHPFCLHVLRLNVLLLCLHVTQVVVTAMLWGAGTAIGEIPPYFLSYKAASAGRRNEMYEGLQEALQTTTGVHNTC